VGHGAYFVITLPLTVVSAITVRCSLDPSPPLAGSPWAGRLETVGAGPPLCDNTATSATGLPRVARAADFGAPYVVVEAQLVLASPQ
jgi:hypothetical protein